MLLLIETGLVVIAVLIAIVYPRLGENWFSAIERRFTQLARRRTLSVFIVGATTLGLRVLLLPVLPVPEPAVHDEFSYLLAADTFAHGRLANPTHPMWVHFETFHVNQKPTYVSMYYPAQGMFLALGQVVLGHPFWGVWLSAGLMCAAICWMLQGWLPPVWALLGGFLALIRLGTFSYWMNSYWGGAVAALGGALVLGALPRVKRHQRLRDIVLMGVGFAIIANSRPYEGVFFSIPVLIGLTLWMRRVRTGPPFRTIALRVIAPLLVMLVLTLGFMGYYFWRTTGSPLRTPYSVNTETYRPTPLFPWQVVKPAGEYQNEVMKNYYLGWAVRQYDVARSHPIVLLILKAIGFWFFFLGPILTIPLIAACFVLPYGTSFRDFSGRTQFLLIICAAMAVAALLPVCFDPHYIAAVTCVIYALLGLAIQRVRNGKLRSKPVGLALVRFSSSLAILMLVLLLARPSLAPASTPETWCGPALFETYRGDIVRRLLKTPGRDLVIVRYSPAHLVQNEWVYNKADIDDSDIVWARDMGPDKNLELIRYFKDRKVWLVEPDVLAPKLTRYPNAENVTSIARQSSTNHEVR